MLLTQTQLREQGRPEAWTRRAVRRGELTRFAPGVFLDGDVGLMDRAAAAVAHAGADAVLTGWAGCHLLGFRRPAEQAAVQVLIGDVRRRVSTSHVQVLRTVRPPRWKPHFGVRVAAPERCVVDAARSLDSLAEVRALVMAAVACGFVPEPSLSAELAAGARNGSGFCRRALLDVRRGAASPPEAELADVALALAARRRLPPFLLNPSVLRDGKLIGVPDGWLPDLGLGWEVDSREFHSEEADFDRTLARHDEFARHGLALLHVTPRRLRQLGGASGAARHGRRPAGGRLRAGAGPVGRADWAAAPVSHGAGVGTSGRILPLIMTDGRGG